MIVGTQTAATGAWTGNASFSELKDGQQIAYWLPYSGSGNATLELTFPDGTTTGAIPCYFSQQTRLSTQYGAGNVIRLTYRENAQYFSYTIEKGWWADANYNTDTYDRVRSGAIKAKEALSYFKFIVADAEGYFQLAAGKPFDVSKPILWVTSNVAAGSSTSNVYLSYASVYLRNHVSSFTGTLGASLYVAGTLNDSIFTPAENYLTCTQPTAEDGLTYLLLGVMTSAYNAAFFPEHLLYRFVNGAFQPLSQVGYQAYAEVGTLRTETQTAIQQTNAAIALKADASTVGNLEQRMESAEQKITPEAITAAVTSSALYAYEKYEGRNYCLNSSSVHTFVDNKYRYESGATSTYTGYNISVSDDFFAHSGSGTNIRISFDMKRTNVDANAASTANVYTGSWIYYRYTYTDGSTKTAGRGWYLRSTDSSFQATDEDWVRMRYGVLNLSSVNPTDIAYFSIGTAAANGTTGTVQFRNIKLEVLDKWTDWSAAPEDIYGMVSRMNNAESRITQNANNIALKVSTSTYNTEKIYRGTTAPTTLYTNMLWLDTSVTPNLLKRYTGGTWVAAGAQEVKSSGIYIGDNNVSITTENFLLQLLDPSDNENVLMEMSADGNVGFKELYADEVISDSVASAYAGPTTLRVNPSYTGTSDTYFRSLGDAMQALNNRYLSKDVTIYLPYGSETYEASGVLIQGITGPGKLTIYGYTSSSILNSYIKVKGCFAHIYFNGLHLRESRALNGTSRQPYLVELQMNHYVEFYNCTLDANNVTYDSVYNKATHAYFNACGFYNALQGLEVFTGQAFMLNCVGSCNWSMISYAGIIIASGTVPAGSRGTGNNGQLFASNVTVDYGTAIPVVTPDETTILYATTTKSYRGSSWRSDTQDVIQGAYSDSGYKSSVKWNYG